jgi:hypothetical protein
MRSIPRSQVIFEDNSLNKHASSEVRSREVSSMIIVAYEMLTSDKWTAYVIARSDSESPARLTKP